MTVTETNLVLQKGQLVILLPCVFQIHGVKVM